MKKSFVLLLYLMCGFVYADHCPKHKKHFTELLKIDDKYADYIPSPILLKLDACFIFVDEEALFLNKQEFFMSVGRGMKKIENSENKDR